MKSHFITTIPLLTFLKQYTDIGRICLSGNRTLDGSPFNGSTIGCQSPRKSSIEPLDTLYHVNKSVPFFEVQPTEDIRSARSAYPMLLLT